MRLIKTVQPSQIFTRSIFKISLPCIISSLQTFIILPCHLRNIQRLKNYTLTLEKLRKKNPSTRLITCRDQVGKQRRKNKRSKLYKETWKISHIISSTITNKHYGLCSIKLGILCLLWFCIVYMITIEQNRWYRTVQQHKREKFAKFVGNILSVQDLKKILRGCKVAEGNNSDIMDKGLNGLLEVE